jgi:hypothetical protein
LPASAACEKVFAPVVARTRSMTLRFSVHLGIDGSAFWTAHVFFEQSIFKK